MFTGKDIKSNYRLNIVKEMYIHADIQSKIYLLFPISTKYQLGSQGLHISLNHWVGHNWNKQSMVGCGYNGLWWEPQFFPYFYFRIFHCVFLLP